jgi:hypothetical protein
MTVKKGKVTDPVDEQGLGVESQDAESAFDPKKDPGVDSGVGLDPNDVGAIRPRAAAAPHPFDGYRLARNVDIGTGETRISATFLVLLKPSEEPVPDISNADVTINTAKKGSGAIGGAPGPDTYEKKVTLGTYHTRTVPNRQNTQNYQFVFDREVLVGDQWYKCAVVPSHSCRAQICFTFDPRKERVMPDKRYLLADTRQAQALFRLFSAIHYQRTSAERNAKEFDDAKAVAFN